MDKQLLAEHAEGLHRASPAAWPPRSGCSSSRASATARARRPPTYRDIFGADRYFIELQDHGLADQRAILRHQVELRARDRRAGGRDERPPLHAARGREAARRPAVHPAAEAPVRPEAAQVRRRGLLPEERGRDARACSRELPEACDATLAIAERVQLLPELERVLVEGTTEYRLPRFETPAGEPLESYLRELVERGAVERYGDPLSTEVIERTDHELVDHLEDGVRRVLPDRVGPDPVRPRAGHPRRARAGDRRPARSCRYCLRITDLDPLRYGLLFERFLNPGPHRRCPTSTWTSTSAVATR